MMDNESESNDDDNNNEMKNNIDLKGENDVDN